MKLKQKAPRNPLVPALQFKKGGAHGKPNKARRRSARIATRRELATVVRRGIDVWDEDTGHVNLRAKDETGFAVRAHAKCERLSTTLRGSGSNPGRTAKPVSEHVQNAPATEFARNQFGGNESGSSQAHPTARGSTRAVGVRVAPGRKTAATRGPIAIPKPR